MSDAPGELAALSAEPDAKTFQMQGRTMKDWLCVDGPSLDDDAVLRSWTERGLAYARSLPPT